MKKPLKSQTMMQWPLWFWLTLVLTPIAFLVLMHQLDRGSALNDVWRVGAADYLASDASRPPQFGRGEQNNWESISIPSSILGNELQPTTGWLRIALPQTEESTTNDWMLFIPRPANTNYSLWLSGVRYASAGHHSAHSTSMPRNPVTLEFSALALRGGDQHIYLRATRELGGINPNNLYLGPAAELRDSSEHATFISKTLIQAILLMMGMMAAVMLLIHILRREHTTLYGWYALGIALWFLHTLHAQHEEASFGSAWFWIRTTYVTLAAYVVAGLVFVNRLTERPQPKIEFALLLTLIAGATFILLDPVGVEGILRFNVALWIPAIILGGIYMVFRIAVGARRQPDPETLLLLAATFFGVCVGIRDYLYNNLQLLPGSMLYLRHAAGLILVAYSFVMVRRFSLSPDQPMPAQAAVITDPTSLVETNSQRALLQQEHDALERQLQQAVLHIEPTEGTAQFNNNLRAARHDLQLIRDMLDRGDNIAPGELLETMQVRLSRSAKRQRVPLVWEQPLVSDISYLTDHYELALARFVQTATLEALAFPKVTQVEVKTNSASAAQNADMILSVSATLRDQTTPHFEKRAQLESAARELKGVLDFGESANECRVELRWKPR